MNTYALRSLNTLIAFGSMLIMASCSQQENTESSVEFTEQNRVPREVVTLEGSQFVSTQQDLSKKNYIALYYSASWCPPCHIITPMLVDFYHKAKAVHGDAFELILVSLDNSEQDMMEYVQSSDIPWPVLQYSQTESPFIKARGAGGPPYLVVLDQQGNEILGKGFNDWAPPQIIMADFAKLLKNT